MSNIEKFEATKEIVLHAKTEFQKIASQIGGMKFEKEKVFAIQALQNNQYLCQIAYQDKDSLKMAIFNIAATGLSLNPVRKLAYLVPRDGKVHLDISYLGFIQLAVDCGAIKWAKAEIVCENDQYTFNGMNQMPTHKYNPFGDRGAIIGCYCIAKTHDDEYMSETMPISEIFGIRDRSKAWIAFKAGKARSCPWSTDEGEMIKKTVIRRAYKSWALTDTRQDKRFEKAIEITHEDHEITTAIDEEVVDQSQEQIERIKGQLEYLNKPMADSIEYLERTCQRKIESLEDLTPGERDKFEAMLKTFVDKNLEQKEQENESSETAS